MNSIGLSPDLQSRVARSRGKAWTTLCLAFMVHVVDEALTDFLSVYNPAVLAVRQRFPLLRLPVFTFETWLTVLLLVIAVLLAFSYFAFQDRCWMAKLSYIFGPVMFLNGLGHLAGSFYLGRALPGAYSSPLLLGAAAYLLAAYTRPCWPRTATCCPSGPR